MTRPTPLLLIAFLAACMPAAPEDAPSEGAGTTRLREPDVRYEPTPQRVVHQMLELARVGPADVVYDLGRSEEHTSELQSLMRISYAVFCLQKKNQVKS